MSSDRTVAAFDWSEPEIDRTLASGGESGHEDGATMVGVAVDDLTTADSRSVLDEDTLGGGGHERPTIIPTVAPGPEVVDPENSVRGGEADVWGGESEAGATLLEGLDSAAVKEAIGQGPAAGPVGDTTLADDGEPDEDEAPELPTFVRPPEGPAVLAGPVLPAAPIPSPGDAAAQPHINGPLRIVVGKDGPAAAEPASGDGVRPPVNIGGIPAHGSDPTVTPYGAGLDVGTDTGRWMAGELDSSRLGWSDEEAGRRAVATRNQASAEAPVVPRPAGGAIRQQGFTTAPPQAISEPPMVKPASAGAFVQRNGPLLGVLTLTFALVFGFAYVWFGTEILWPKLQIETLPPGAKVTVDGERQAGRTPLAVVVEPGRRHRIELRVDGYAPALREITEGIGRGRTYALEVALDRVPPTLFIGPKAGSVFVNGRSIGMGREVRLPELPPTGQVRIRVEAERFEPYEVIFESSAKIPISLDVPLEPRS